MPNIEIHGVPLLKMEGLVQAVFTAIERDAEHLADEAVVTWSNDTCVNRHNEPRPFFRIHSTNPVHTNTIKTLLQAFQSGPVKMDIEVGSPITEFIPAPE